jgi:hypothetical protein
MNIDILEDDTLWQMMFQMFLILYLKV